MHITIKRSEMYKLIGDFLLEEAEKWHAIPLQHSHEHTMGERHIGGASNSVISANSFLRGLSRGNTTYRNFADEEIRIG